ncbi:hypothetical protein CWC26_17925 [Pseudoalteromonas sp. S4488]|nr:hypothetical protein CWC27_13575 [Pseudoalteromonas sp. S4491]TMO35646.1 hypothetical protein CWC26_17925 [Pseudoalteromonas sp. S4488]
MILIIEPLLLAINALPKSLLIPTETRILRWFGYIEPSFLTGLFIFEFSPIYSNKPANRVESSG